MARPGFFLSWALLLWVLLSQAEVSFRLVLLWAGACWLVSVSRSAFRRKTTAWLAARAGCPAAQGPSGQIQAIATRRGGRPGPPAWRHAAAAGHTQRHLQGQHYKQPLRGSNAGESEGLGR